MSGPGSATSGAAWRSAAAVGLLAVAAGLLYSLVAMPFLLSSVAWRQSPDAWLNLVAAHYVPWGGFPLIYEAGMKGGSGLFVAGPVLPVLLSPVALVSDLTGATESYPFPLRRPGIWLLLLPYGIALGIPMLAAVRSLAAELGARVGLVRSQLASAVVAILPASIVYGHYEDVLAVGFAAFAARDAHRGRAARAGVLLALAICSKQWAALAVPVVVALLPGGSRRSFLAAAVGIPAIVFGFFLAADWEAASRALLRPPSFPSFGHAAFWLSPDESTVVGSPGRVLALLAAAAIAWGARARAPGARAAALGLVFLARLPFEPVVFSYYLAPGLVFLAIDELVERGRVSRTLLGGALMMLWFYAPSGPAWWVGEAVLAMPLVVPAVRRIRGVAVEPAPAPVPAAA